MFKYMKLLKMLFNKKRNKNENNNTDESEARKQFNKTVSYGVDKITTVLYDVINLAENVLDNDESMKSFNIKSEFDMINFTLYEKLTIIRGVEKDIQNMGYNTSVELVGDKLEIKIIKQLTFLI